VPIGTWVLEEACRTAAAWQQQGLEPGMVSVNVSALQFARLNFAQTVTEILERTGLPATALELELTESMVMADAEESARQMWRLKDVGVHLAIDDFGTGYSSLSYLHQLPIDTLKVDQSFVALLRKQEASKSIVESIITLARALGVQTVAEGVETAEQWKQLRALGCDHFQGYWFHRPMPRTEVEVLLRTVRAESAETTSGL
jgi:EAL domain-containing protein (putative c-di-GMP-specific phosphodiesterase class I)